MSKLLLYIFIFVIPFWIITILVIIVAAIESITKLPTKKTYIALNIIFSLYFWSVVCTWAHGEDIFFGFISPLYLLTKFSSYAYEFRAFIVLPLLLSLIITACLVLTLKQKNKKIYPIPTQIFFLTILLITCEIFGKYEMYKQAKIMDLDCVGIPKSFIKSVSQNREFPSWHAVAHKEDVAYLWSYKNVNYVALSPNSKRDLSISEKACQNFFIYKK